MGNEIIEALVNALSGIGVDEKILIESLGGKGKGKEEDDVGRGLRNNASIPFFSKDDSRLFEKWNDFHVAQLKREFLRFNNAMVLRMMHPWERDARLLKDAIIDGAKSYNVIVELACTRSSEQLLGARKAFHSLFHRSLEEDVADHVHTLLHRKLLVALVSSYRYEGPKVKEDTAKAEANILHSSFLITKRIHPFELHEQLVRILSTRSKTHLRAVFRFYNQLIMAAQQDHIIDHHHHHHHQSDDDDNNDDYGTTTTGDDDDDDDDFDDNNDYDELTESYLSLIKDAMQCLDSPPAYFVKVLDAAMEKEADENTKEGITRVLVTRADIDMKEIEQEYMMKHNNQISLYHNISTLTKGNFRDFLLTIIAGPGGPEGPGGPGGPGGPEGPGGPDIN